VVSSVAELSGRPREILYHAPRSLRLRIEETLECFDPDLVQVQYWFTAGMMPRECGVPVWVDSMDVHARRERTIAETYGSGPLKWWHTRRSTLVDRHEFAAYHAADRVLAVQDVERQIIEDRTESRHVLTVPITLDVPSEPVQRQPEQIVAFLGAMDYQPNRDAVAFLIERVMPHVRRVVPSCMLKVVGGGAERWQKRFPIEWVHWLGRVASLETAMRDVSVAVAPMRSGSGTNVKVLSLLGMGLPVVATHRAVEGLGLVSGVQLLVEDEPEEISQKIVTLLSDRDLALRLGGQGHIAIWKNYHWKNAVSRVCGLYEREMSG
jgi:glycosyltransferase involved in cell wall biosynthesis